MKDILGKAIQDWFNVLKPHHILQDDHHLKIYSN